MLNLLALYVQCALSAVGTLVYTRVSAQHGRNATVMERAWGGAHCRWSARSFTLAFLPSMAETRQLWSVPGEARIVGGRHARLHSRFCPSAGKCNRPNRNTTAK